MYSNEHGWCYASCYVSSLVERCAYILHTRMVLCTWIGSDRIEIVAGIWKSPTSFSVALTTKGRNNQVMMVHACRGSGIPPLKVAEEGANQACVGDLLLPRLCLRLQFLRPASPALSLTYPIEPLPPQSVSMLLSSSSPTTSNNQLTSFS